MMSAVRIPAAFCLLALIFFFIGCGSTTQAPIAVTLSASSLAIDQAQTVNLTASVTNDSKNAGVQWSASNGGSLGSTTPTSAVYTAPVSVTSSFPVAVTATSISDSTKSASVRITVNPLPAIPPTQQPIWVAGTPNSATVSVSGGSAPFTWSISSGTLPPGLSLGSSKYSSAPISGTPTQAVNNQAVTIMVTDATGVSATEALTITVEAAPPLTISTGSLPTGYTGIAYSQTLQATGGVPSYQWSVISGSLPSGLTLNSSTGAITGTPTALGTSSFTVKVSDSQTPTPASTTANLSITINNPPLAVTTTSLPEGVINVAYSSTAFLTANGGTAPYTWSISSGSLPNGLQLNASTGQITGTPTKTGTFPFTAKVTDSSSPTQTATANLSIVINSPLEITTTSLPSGSVGTSYSATLAASGGVPPYSWTVTSGDLPAGLSLNKTTAVISGTPTATGTSTFTVSVSDSETPTEESTTNLSITISSASCPNNASFKGNYTTAMEGWNTDSTAVQSAALASFAADGNGNITGGILDTDDGNNGHQNGTFTGTYCISSNNLGTMKLTLSAPYSTTNTFAVTLNSTGSNGRIMFYDSTNTKEVGPLLLQDTSAFSTSKIDGDYAFGMVGVDSVGGSARFAVAGQFNSNGSGTLSGIADGNDLLSGVSSQVTLTASDFTVASSGRGTVTLNFSGGSMNFSLQFAFDVVSATQLAMIETDGPKTDRPLLVGQALQQSTTAFTDASLDGNAIVASQSLTSGTTPSVSGGIITTNGAGTSIGLSLDQNVGGTVGTFSGSGTYSVASNGRVTLSGSGLGNNPPVLYLVTKNQGFVVGTDGGVTFGAFYPQSGSNFSTSSLDGSFTGGSDRPQNDLVGEQVDALTSDGKGNLTGTAEKNVNGGSPTQNSITETYSVSLNGRVVVSEAGAQTEILYIVNSGFLLAIPVDSGDDDPKVIWLLQ
jgi:hypothetical protein